RRDALATAQHSHPSPEAASRREEIAACERQLDQYRATLDAGGDPGVVGQWITETQARKLTAETRLRACQAARPAPGRMTKQQIAAVADALTGLMDVLHDAEPADKAAIYAALGLRLTYPPGPGPRMATVSLEPGRSCTKGSCPRGDLNSGITESTGHHLRASPLVIDVPPRAAGIAATASKYARNHRR